jgi:hypothetical protein
MIIIRVPTDFWRATPIRPIPTLARLRDLVLAHSEHRSPKWKFRFEPDLVCQIQPKLTKALLRFECLAIVAEGADAKTLTTPRAKLDHHYVSLRFDLRASVPDAWEFKPRGLGWKPQDAASPNRLATDDLVSLRAGLVATFDSDWFEFLHPEKLLAASCMICGKGLHDPVSMARRIGPECWGSSSQSLPWIVSKAA